jgi:hypothetical protein
VILVFNFRLETICMKMLMPLLILPLAAACSTTTQRGNIPSPAAPQQEATDIALVHALSDTAINNAIITQHTIFPYHFITGSADLNELGQRELAVLCDHYRIYGGPLNVRQGDAADALFQQRLSRVREVLASSGIKSTQVPVADAQPGGPGIYSARAVEILKAKDDTKVDYETSGKVSAPAVKGER